VDRLARLAAARLYLCTPDRPDLAEFVGAVCHEGVDVVQLRDKAAEEETLVARAGVAMDAAHAAGALFIVNDRPDLAVRVGADGVHVGQDDATPLACRKLLGDQAIVGLSTHAPAELDAALLEPVDYVSVGPVTSTPTKPGRPGTGLGYVEYASRRCSIPFFVTGGVGPDTLADIAAAGARRFVVVRALTEAADVPTAVSITRHLRDLITAI